MNDKGYDICERLKDALPNQNSSYKVMIMIATNRKLLEAGKICSPRMQNWDLNLTTKQ